MTYYGAKELSESSRTVRKNTILTGEDIPEDQYNFQATPDTGTVAPAAGSHRGCLQHPAPDPRR